jgi:hypothetical protein
MLSGKTDHELPLGVAEGHGVTVNEGFIQVQHQRVLK